MKNKRTVKKSIRKSAKKISAKDFPTLKLKSEWDIAMDFAEKVYKKFNKMIKSVILFGSSVKKTKIAGSDIDIMIIIDDATISWDQELIAWYREELGKLIRANPYRREMHINTTRLKTWWKDLIRGDPIVMDIIRFGEPLIDFGGFFTPLKILLQEGEIKPTPEAIYTALQRAPQHIARSKIAEMSSIEGVYWAMVDSAHAALMAAKTLPPSPEHIPLLMKKVFVDKGMLKMDYVVWFRDIYLLHRKITHGEITNIQGVEIDDWQEKSEKFVKVMAELIEKLTER